MRVPILAPTNKSSSTNVTWPHIPWAKPGRYVLTTVTDTGIGMPKDVAEHIFEPFFTTKSPRAGTGLGLAVAYGIVRQHSGMLHCYSEEKVGTSFKIYLPVLERMATAVGTKLQRAVRSGTERVLLAEDDPGCAPWPRAFSNAAVIR